MEVNDFKFFSAPVEIQINSEGIVSALAKNKLEDAAQDRGFLASWISMPPAGRVSLADAAPVLARGYNGTQIFNTTYATRDPLEPQHCGIAGGASYWFSYRPPDSGEMTINTEGSNYDTLLAVYTSAGPLTSYADLIPITCDDNSGANGRTSRVGFTASFRPDLSDCHRWGERRQRYRSTQLRSAISIGPFRSTFYSGVAAIPSWGCRSHLGFASRGHGTEPTQLPVVS